MNKTVTHISKNITIILSLLLSSKDLLASDIDTDEIKQLEQIYCTKRESKLTSYEQKVYQWKDSQGRVHFSDKAPLNQLSTSKSYTHQANLFSLNINSQFADMTLNTEENIRQDTQSIYRILSQQLGQDFHTSVVVKLSLFANKKMFERHKALLGSNVNTNTGFYSVRKSEAVVLQWPNSQFNYQVIRHEITHLIISKLYGITPIWFNEGLAELFEGLESQGQSQQFVVPDKMHELALKYAIDTRLNQLFELETEDFYRNESKNYPLSWSVLHYLMQYQNGLLRQLLETFRQKPCQRFNMKEWLDQNFNGGYTAFEHDWRSKLNSLSIIYF